MGTEATGWRLKRRAGIEYYELETHPDLLLAFTTRARGVSHRPYDSLNFAPDVGDDPAAVEQNYALLRHALRLPVVATFCQTHSAQVVPVASGSVPRDRLRADAAFTDLPGVALAVKVADCLPVYIFSQDPSCAGIAHCGWRGTAARLASRLAQAVSARFAVPLSRLSFALGPCICPDCYEVGEDVLAYFRARFPAAGRFFAPAGARPPRHRLDIRAANRWLLTGMGLTEQGSLELCTREDDRHCYSVRRSRPTGRNLALVMLRSARTKSRG